jgi:hypothetical protein
MRSTSRLAICFVALSAAFNSTAADFSYKKMENGELALRMDGEIKTGDASKLKRLIANTTGSYYHSAALMLNSRGGSIGEAIAIANIVQESGEVVWVDSGEQCASACFLIYASAPMRAGSGDVIVHRPYFDMTKITGSSEANASRAYQESIISMRLYLQSRAIPDDIIDNLMQKSSNDGYTLTYQDKVRIGFMSPSVTEVAIQKCALRDKAAIFQPDNRRSWECVITYLAQTKLDYLINLRKAVSPKNTEKSRKNQ